MRNLLSTVVQTLVLPNTKAIVAFIVASFVSFMAQQGIVLDDATQNATVAAIGGIFTALFVWLFPNRGA